MYEIVTRLEIVGPFESAIAAPYIYRSSCCVQNIISTHCHILDLMIMMKSGEGGPMTSKGHRAGTDFHAHHWHFSVSQLHDGGVTVLILYTISVAALPSPPPKVSLNYITLMTVFREQLLSPISSFLGRRCYCIGGLFRPLCLTAVCLPGCALWQNGAR